MFDQYQYLINIIRNGVVAARVFFPGPKSDIKAIKKKYSGSDEDFVSQMLDELQHKEVQMKDGDFLISGVPILGFDSIKVFQEKLAQISGIPPFRQYLSSNYGGPITHDIYDSSGKIDSKFGSEKDNISGIPVNTTLANRDIYYIIGTEYSRMMYEISGPDINELYLVDLYDYVNPGVILDKYAENMVYYGFVRIYWPISWEVYYNINKLDLHESFPDLFSYENINYSARYGLFSGEFDPKIHNGVSGMIKYVEFIVYGSSRINNHNLFNILRLNKNIPISRILARRRGKNIMITKTYTGVDYIHLYLSYKRSFNITRKDILFLYMKGESVYIIIITGRYYRVQVFGGGNDFENIRKTTADHIKWFIEMINSLDYFIFLSDERLPFPNKSNMIVNNLSSVVTYPVNIPPDRIFGLNEFIEKKVPVLSFSKSELYSSDYTFHGEYNSNVMSYMQKNTGEYYDYMSNVTSRDIFNVYCPLDYGITVKFDTYFMLNLTEIDMNMNNLISMLFTYILSNFKFNVETSNINFKSLKKIDPELYDMRRYGTDKQIGRICQRKFQPIAITPDNFDALSDKEKIGYVKYWNFTTNSPLYYKCPDKDIPHLSFIVSHPMSYCIPCCGKKAIKPNTKKGNIYEKCVRDYVFVNEEDQNSSFKRYIMNYNSDKLEKGRMYKLPDELLRSIVSYSYMHPRVDKVSIDGIYYNINNILNLIGGDKIRTVNISNFMDTLDDFIPNKHVTYRQLLDNNSLSPKYFRHIMNTDKTGFVLIHKKRVVYNRELFVLSVINGEKTINAKRVNDKILKRSRKIGINIQYYIFTVESAYKNINNIGSLHALANILDKESSMLLDEIIGYLSRKDSPIDSDIFGIYSSQFTSPKRMITSFLYDINENIDPRTNWNELVIRCVRNMYDITIVTVIYSQGYYLDTSGDFVLRAKTCFLLRDVGYSPILYTSSRNFLNNIVKSIFDDTDIIYNYFSQMLVDIKGEHTEVFFNIFNEHIKSIIMLNNILAYGVMIEFNDRLYMLPMEYTEVIREYPKKINYIHRSDITYTYKEFKSFVEFYNLAIIQESEKRGWYKHVVEKTSEDPINAREDKIIPVIPLIRVDEYIEYNDQIIGISSSGLYFYFSPGDILDIDDHFRTGYNIVRDGKVRVLLYDPDHLNDVLNNFVIASPNVREYKSGLYRRYILTIASLELLDIITGQDKLDHFLKNPDYSKVYYELSGLVKKHFSMTKPDFNDEYRIVKCGIERSIFCKKSKIAIDPELVEPFITGFIEDIRNPAKMKLLMNNMNIYSIYNKYEFKRHSDEKIFVKID